MTRRNNFVNKLNFNQNIHNLTIKIGIHTFVNNLKFNLSKE